MNDKERRELVSRIERGEYVTYETPSYPLKNNGILLATLAIIYLAFLLARNILRGVNVDEEIKKSVENVFWIYPYAAIGIFVLLTIIWLASYFKKKSKIYDLGKLSGRDKGLILKGDAIIARLDSIVDNENGTKIKCSAEYGGQRLNFESPAIRAQILPIEEQSVVVFVANGNPQRDYLVNFYDHIPRRGPRVLKNKESLKYGERTEEDHWRRIVLSIAGAILLIFFWPLLIGFVMLALAPLVEVIFAIKNNDMASLAAFGMLLILEISLAFYIRHKLRRSGAIKRGSRAWRPSNYYLNVVVDKYWTTEYVVRGENGKTTHKVHHISATYIEPDTKYMYVFTATGPAMISRLQGHEVRVYVKANNMYKYYVDIITALQNNGVKYDNTGFIFDDNGTWYEK